MSRTRILIALGAVGAAAQLAGGTVLATQALATTRSGVVTGAITFGAIPGHTVAEQDGVALTVAADSTAAVTTITYPVGSYSGWHSHPGIVIATVESGIVIRKVGCRTERFDAGDSFTEVAPHNVMNAYNDDADNPDAAPAVLKVTQIYPATAPARRIEASEPVCRPRPR